MQHCIYSVVYIYVYVIVLYVYALPMDGQSMVQKIQHNVNRGYQLHQRINDLSSLVLHVQVFLMAFMFNG